MAVKGITFDLWDTIFIDDSDEPKRKAAGRTPKPVERRRLVKEFVEKHEPVSRRLVDEVYDAVDAEFNKVWHERHITWNVGERLSLVLRRLGRSLPDSELEELVRLHEEMELTFRPGIVPGVHEALRDLQGRYRLAVISDAIFSPGRALRTLLSDEGLLGYFDLCVFSDELGRSKPHPDVFHTTCRGLSIEPGELVHVGDREHNDITGAHAAGAKAVLCTAVVDRGSDKTQADAVFSDYHRLFELIQGLST